MGISTNLLLREAGGISRLLIRTVIDAAIREHDTTLGETRVSVDLNPSDSKTIADLKRRAADFIDAVDAIELPGEIARLKALAMTEIESAVLWAVMAAARSEAASRLPGVTAQIATTLKAFCEAVGWPRLRRLSDAIARVRESERRAAAAPKPAPAPGPALTADPQGEIYLAVTWQREIDDSGGKYPPAESGDEHMQQSPQGDLFSAPPEPLAERYELGVCAAGIAGWEDFISTLSIV